MYILLSGNGILIKNMTLNSRYDVQRIFSGKSIYIVPNTLEHLEESLDIVARNESFNSLSNKMFTYTLLLRRMDSWQPILTVVEQREQLIVKELVENTFADEETLEICDSPGECSRE